MKVLLAILATVLVLPIVFIIGIALGPAMLVMVFIAGFALLVSGLFWLAGRLKPR